MLNQRNIQTTVIILDVEIKLKSVWERSSIINLSTCFTHTVQALRKLVLGGGNISQPLL